MKTEEERLNIHLKPSRLFAGFLLLSHSLALFFCLSLPLAPQLLSGSLLLIFCSLSWNWYSHLSNHNLNRLKEVISNSDGSWLLIDYADRVYSAKLLPSTTVFTFLTILNFSYGTFHRKNIVLFPDSLEADQMRRLRVRLGGIECQNSS